MVRILPEEKQFTSNLIKKKDDQYSISYLCSQDTNTKLYSKNKQFFMKFESNYDIGVYKTNGLLQKNEIQYQIFKLNIDPDEQSDIEDLSDSESDRFKQLQKIIEEGYDWEDRVRRKDEREEKIQNNKQKKIFYLSYEDFFNNQKGKYIKQDNIKIKEFRYLDLQVRDGNNRIHSSLYKSGFSDINHEIINNYGMVKFDDKIYKFNEQEFNKFIYNLDNYTNNTLPILSQNGYFSFQIDYDKKQMYIYNNIEHYTHKILNEFNNQIQFEDGFVNYYITKFQNTVRLNKTRQDINNYNNNLNQRKENRNFVSKAFNGVVNYFLKHDNEQEIPDEDILDNWEEKEIIQKHIKKCGEYLFNYKLQLNKQCTHLELINILDQQLCEIKLHKKPESSYSKFLIQITNKGNLEIIDENHEILWQSFTAGKKHKLFFYFFQIFEQIIDPLLFLSDAITDIILIVTFYQQQHYNYFAYLIVSLILERIFQFFLNFMMIKENFNELKINLSDKIPEKFKYCYSLLTIIYLEPILVPFYDTYSVRQNLKFGKKLIEISIESLPSTFINFHSIYYQIELGEQIYFTQYLSLALSLITASKTLYELKVKIQHKNSWQKLMGPKQYESGNGNTNASIQTFLMGLIFLFSYTISLQVFLDINRPDGILFYCLSQYIIFLFLTLPVLYYGQDRFKFGYSSFSSLNQNEKILFICKIVLSVIFAPFLMTFTFTAGFNLDWILDRKNDDFDEKEKYFGINFITAILRLIYSLLFFSYYINEIEIYQNDKSGYITIFHMLYTLVYLVLFIKKFREKNHMSELKEVFKLLK